MFRYETAGESHGPGITTIVSGVPAGLQLDLAAVNAELRRRQSGYGRGGRQSIEEDSVEVLAGLRKGLTSGAPLALLVRNRDSRLEKTVEMNAPRPGHADLAGHQSSGAPIRDVLERASARETAGRVAAGAVAKQLLASFGVSIDSHVKSIGEVDSGELDVMSPQNLASAERSDVRCISEEASAKMRTAIDDARGKGESLGGVFQVVAFNVPAGLGSYAERSLGLDALLAGAFVSIPAIKGVEIGPAFENAARVGSSVHDPIVYDAEAAPRAGGFLRKTNRAGGIEGGVSNGMPVIVTAAMKPIPTLTTPLESVDIASRTAVAAATERSDVCAVPAASVVGEAMMAIILADALLRRLGSGGMQELRERFGAMLKRLREAR